MDPGAFIEQLDREVSRALGRIGEAARAPPSRDVSVADLLGAALRNELEAAEEAAIWMAGEPDLELKLGFARQCGDEARHFRLIGDRLRALGRDPFREEQLARGPTPMFRFLKTLATPAERLAAGAFAREGLAVVRNRVFADYCEAKGDLETARLYREVIGPDEAFHHELGRRLLPRYAVTAEDQARALRAAARTLQLAEELQEIARLKHGISSSPGC
jgi:hypothetical protein